jgi:hypothetical protein
MAKGFALTPLIVVTALLATPAKANTCTAKRIKAKHVCGVVVDGAGTPIQGATLQLFSDKDEPLTSQTVTQSDGRFSLENAPEGDLFLAISAPQHNSGRWPLKVTGKTKVGQCSKPLKVHLAGGLGAACGDWVDQK